VVPIAGDIVFGALKAQMAQQEDWRKKFGSTYRADLDLVFSAPDGGFLRPDTATSAACGIVKKAGFVASDYIPCATATGASYSRAAFRFLS
jgi:hypothetical protein